MLSGLREELGCLEESEPRDWLEDRCSEIGKRNIGRGGLALWFDGGGEVEVIVPVETIAGRWGMSFGLEENCVPFAANGSFASRVSLLR